MAPPLIESSGSLRLLDLTEELRNISSLTTPTPKNETNQKQNVTFVSWNNGRFSESPDREVGSHLQRHPEVVRRPEVMSQLVSTST